MGTYMNSREEIADALNEALEKLEGDFDPEELQMAFVLVAEEQERIRSGEGEDEERK